MSERIVNETDRQRRGRVLAELGHRYSRGYSTERAMEDLEILRERGIDTRDLVEAGQRIKTNRTKESYPALQEILAQCGEARTSRLLAARAESDGPEERGRPMTPDEVDHGKAIMQVYKAGFHWCPVCRSFGAFCPEHRDADWHPPRASVVFDLAARLDSGEVQPLRVRTVSGKGRRQRIVPTPGSGVARSIAYVAERLAKRGAGIGKPAKSQPARDLTHLATEFDDMGGLF